MRRHASMDDQFFGMRRPIRECILGRMAEVIRETMTVGIVIGIEQAEFDAGLKGQYYRVRTKPSADNRVQFTERKPYTLAPLVGSQYSLCILRCIHGINQWLDEQQMQGQIEYVIEAGCPHQDEADAILGRLSLSKLAQKYRFRKFSFVKKGPDNPWLFAPDYFVWAWQRNDRVSEGAIGDEYGDWQKALIPLIGSKPHFATYLTAQSVNTQALINFANGLTRAPPDGL
jgi:hypothetical protein